MHDWKNVQANMLMAMMYEKMGEQGLQRRHLAIAKVQRMRDLNLLAPKNQIPKNFRTQGYELKVEIIDFKNVNTKDQQLSADHSDNLFFEFIDFLLENMIYNLADSALRYVQNHETERYLITLSKIRAYQGRYLEAVEPLDKLLKSEPKHQQAWILRGHAFFLNGNLFDSEESYI